MSAISMHYPNEQGLVTPAATMVGAAMLALVLVVLIAAISVAMGYMILVCAFVTGSAGVTIKNVATQRQIRQQMRR